tara:strand:- start:608 stop:742 length:135 start_codon:yes stop_codon:yes gene_type:complete
MLGAGLQLGLVIGQHFLPEENSSLRSTALIISKINLKSFITALC